MRESFYTRNIKAIIDNEDILHIINYLRQKNVLKFNICCEYCGNEMVQVAKTSSIDKHSFRCLTKDCDKYQTHLSIRHGSFIEEFTISLKKFVEFVYFFSMELDQSQLCELVGISRSTVNKLVMKIRKQCQNYFAQNPPKLGGPGIIVEIDESKFNLYVKSHRGRASISPTWVFGLVDTSFQPARGIMKVAERRD